MASGSNPPFIPNVTFSVAAGTLATFPAGAYGEAVVYNPGSTVAWVASGLNVATAAPPGPNGSTASVPVPPGGRVLLGGMDYQNTVAATAPVYVTLGSGSAY